MMLMDRYNVLPFVGSARGVAMVTGLFGAFHATA